MRPDLALFYQAFMDLNTCRASGADGSGPIPWTAIQLYCNAHKIVGEQQEDVFYHVERMDQAYLAWALKKREQLLSTKEAK